MQRILLIVGLLLGMVIFTGCTCIPKLKADQRCRESRKCKGGGRCTADKIESIDGHDSCIAASDSDCKKSDNCGKDGKCTAKDGKCVAGSNSDCGESTGCKEDGKCTVKDDICRHGSDADCRKSEGCKVSGQCTYIGKDRYGRVRCRATSSADCRKSSYCRTQRFCYFRKNTNVRSGRCVQRHNLR